jgi:hypothetical protein
MCGKPFPRLMKPERQYTGIDFFLTEYILCKRHIDSEITDNP